MAMIVGSTKRPISKPPMVEQKKKPVLLTNGCCEDCGSFTVEDLKTLGLQWGNDKGDPKFEPDFDGDCFYPLTPDEMQYIGEDTAACKMRAGGAELAYSCIYKGKKWLCPCIEVCYWPSKPPRPFSKGSYGGTLFATREASVVEVKRLERVLTGKMKAVGGHLCIDYDEPSECGAGTFSDRHAIWLVLPFDLAFGIAPPDRPEQDWPRGTAFLMWKSYLSGLLAGV